MIRLRFLFSAVLLTPALLLGQSSSSVQVPPRPREVKTVSPALKASADASHAAWKQREGAGLHAGLTYIDGAPILMLFTETAETPAKNEHRKRAIVSACEALLDDLSFDRVTVTVVSSHPANPREQTTRNYEITRTKFKETALRVTQQPNAKEAVKRTLQSKTTLEEVCAALGVK